MLFIILYFSRILFNQTLFNGMSYDRCRDNSENVRVYKRKSRDWSPRDSRDWRETRRETIGYDQLHATHLCGNACAPIDGHARMIGPATSPLCRHHRSRHESHSAIPRTIGHLVTHELSPAAGGVARMLRHDQLLTSAHVTHTVHQGVLLCATRVPRYVGYPLGARLGKLHGYPRRIFLSIPTYKSECCFFLNLI